MLDRHRIVVVPPDNCFGVRVAHDELVLRAASGMRARVGDEGPMRGDTRFIALQRVFVELRCAKIPIDLGKLVEAEPVRAKVEIVRPVLDHLERSHLKARKMEARISTIRKSADAMWRPFGGRPVELAIKAHPSLAI